MYIISLLTKKIEKLVSCMPFCHNILGLYYKNKVKKEINLGKICSNDKVICIGCGSVPCTAFQIIKKTGAYVNIVDTDPIAVKNCKKLIKKLNLEDKANVIQGKGEEIDFKEATIIHVALQAFPSDKILKNILKNTSESVRILLRSPNESIKQIYSILNKFYPKEPCYCIEEKYDKKRAKLMYINRKGGHQDEKVIPANNRSNICNHTSMAS